MGLLLQVLQKQVRAFARNNMRLKVLGSRERFNRQILQGIEEAGSADGEQSPAWTPEHRRGLRRPLGIAVGGKQTDCRRRIRDYGRCAGETL